MEDAEGMTLFETWMVLLREDYEFFQTIFESDTLSDRGLDLVSTLNHEAVHFFSSFTQSFSYNYMKILQNLCVRIMANARQGLLDAKKLRSLREVYNSYDHLITDRKFGASVIDLLESMAVTESFRLSSSKNTTLRNFKAFLRKFFPYEDSTYRRAINIVIQNFGIESALELTPRLCFLALNGDNPGRNFQFFIRRLNELTIIGLPNLKALDLCTIFEMDPADSLLRKYRELSEDKQCKFLTPYVEKLHTLGSFVDIFEYAARPGDLAKESDPEFGQIMFPPVILFNNGKHTKSDLFKQLSEDDQFFYFDLAAIMGACERLLLKEELYQYCPHEKCPIHKTALCHMWYAVPQNIPWAKCAFPKRLKVQFGMDAKSLMQVRTDSFK